MKISKAWFAEQGGCPAILSWFQKQDETDSIKIIEYFIKNTKYFVWANWLLPRIMDRRQCISYALHACDVVLPIYEAKYPKDKEPRRVVDMIRRHMVAPTKKEKMDVLRGLPITIFRMSVEPNTKECDAAHTVYYALEAVHGNPHTRAEMAVFYAHAATDLETMVGILKYGMDKVKDKLS